MEETSEELQQKNAKLNAQLERETARAEKAWAKHVNCGGTAAFLHVCVCVDRIAACQRQSMIELSPEITQSKSCRQRGEYDLCRSRGPHIAHSPGLLSL